MSDEAHAVWCETVGCGCVKLTEALRESVEAARRREESRDERALRPTSHLEVVEWSDDPWCLNAWPGAVHSEHVHYCRYEYGHAGRCVCEYCRSWTLEPAPTPYPVGSLSRAPWEDNE